MARVYLLSAAPPDSPDPKAFLDLEQLRASAAADRFGAHSVAPDPEAADLILFAETSGAAGRYFGRVLGHPLYKANRSRSYLFCSTDRPLAVLPGVYASIERRWYRDAWTRSCGYLGVKEGGALTPDPRRRPSLLFSFVGSGSAHPLRHRILALADPSAALIDSDRRPLDPAAYADTIHDSAFVLCPRGGGTATFRLFEAMMLGRAPVILSDQWVPPIGPDWDSFSLRVRERDVDSLPEMLAARASEAAAMGTAARAAWLDWFAPEAAFHRIVESCVELAKTQPARSGLRRYSPLIQFLRPMHGSRAAASILPGRR